MVNFCFADKAFSSFDQVLKSYPFGNIIYWIFKLFFFKNSSSTEAFVKSKAYKLVSSDPLDSIIPEEASLKSGIAHHMILKLKSENFLNQNSTINKKSNNLLENIFEPKDLNAFVQSVVYIIKSIKTGK